MSADELRQRLAEEEAGAREYHAQAQQQIAQLAAEANAEIERRNARIGLLREMIEAEAVTEVTAPDTPAGDQPEPGRGAE